MVLKNVQQIILNTLEKDSVVFYNFVFPKKIPSDNRMLSRIHECKTKQWLNARIVIIES